MRRWLGVMVLVLLVTAPAACGDEGRKPPCHRAHDDDGELHHHDRGDDDRTLVVHDHHDDDGDDHHDDGPC